MTLMVLCAYSQEENSVDSKTTKKLTKAQKNEQRKAEEKKTASMVDWMVQNRQFVLEANYLSNQTGERIIVNSNLNFIVIDSTNITIQLASTTGIGGANGMGGVTADGKISVFEVKKTGRNKDNYSIRVMAMTVIGSYDIFFSISPSSYADASISGTTSGKLNYHGQIVPKQVSRVFKGMAL